MKKFSKIILLSIALLSFACSDDDEGPAYDFKDQTLQGLINSKSWAFVDGSAEISAFDESKLSIELGAVELEDPCDIFGFSGLRVFFSIDNEVGLKELNFSFEEEGQTVTLFDPEGTLNIIATAGAVEILSISSTEVSGRIDARSEGSDDGVNGNFTVSFCE